MVPKGEEDTGARDFAVEPTSNGARETAPVKVVRPSETNDPAAPLVSVRAEGATMGEILRQMGVEVPRRVEVTATANRFRYTMEAEERPFWEVFLEMQAQRPSMGVREPEKGGTMLIDDGGQKGWVGERKGHLAMLGFYHAPSRTTTGQTFPSNLSTVLGIDPRLQVVEAEVATDGILDEGGHVLYSPENDRLPVPAEFAKHTPNNCIRRQFDLKAPAEGVLPIPEVKIRARVIYAVSSEEKEFKNVEEAVNKPVVMGKTTVRITSFREEGQVFMGIDSKAEEGTAYVIYELYDREGALARRWTWAGEQASGAPSGAGGPFRLKLIVPQKVKEVREEFTLRDLVAIP
jgi:hypothetical protein